jgi:hypothetical protein
MEAAHCPDTRSRPATGRELGRTGHLESSKQSDEDDDFEENATVTKPVNRTTGRAPARRLISAAVAVLGAASPVAVATNAYAATAGTSSYRATDDAYTSSTRTGLNTGGADRLVAGRLNGDNLVTYLKFRVGALPGGTTVTGAKVTLTRDEHHLPGTVKLAAVAATGWSESTITRANAPAAGAVAATLNPDSAAQTVSFDVGKLVRGAGTYTFAVTSPATDDVARFRSAEYDGSAGPRLTLTTRSADATPASPATCTTNAKLVPSCGVLWGAAAGGFTDVPRDQALRTWEATTGRVSTVYHTYHKGDELFPTADEIAMTRETGKPRVLMLNWKVAYGSTWANVAAGKLDARIDREAEYLKKNFTAKFFLVIQHEPENDVNSTAGSGMTAKDFAAMFRHTVDRLRADGVGNAVSTLVYMSYEKFNNQSWWYDLYPGDAWVDWIALDSYVSAQPGGFHNGDFTYLVNRTTDATRFPGYYTWVTAQHPNKPFMVAEWGVFEYAADPTRKAAIYAKVLDELKALPAIKGLLYFDAPNPPVGGDTRVDSSPQALTEFRKIAADPIFNVKLG